MEADDPTAAYMLQAGARVCKCLGPDFLPYTNLISSQRQQIPYLTVLGCSQAQGVEADDPTAAYMLQAGARVCKCLGPDFLPYMELVVNSLCQLLMLRSSCICRHKALRQTTPLQPTCCKQAHACASAWGQTSCPTWS